MTLAIGVMGARGGDLTDEVRQRGRIAWGRRPSRADRTSTAT